MVKCFYNEKFEPKIKSIMIEYGVEK